MCGSGDDDTGFPAMAAGMRRVKEWAEKRKYPRAVVASAQQLL
jgi:hypothetical protein